MPRAIYHPSNFLRNERRRNILSARADEMCAHNIQLMVCMYACRSPLCPSKFFSATQLFCSRLSIGSLSYDSRSTLIRLDRRKNWVECDCVHVKGQHQLDLDRRHLNRSPFVPTARGNLAGDTPLAVRQPTLI